MNLNKENINKDDPIEKIDSLITEMNCNYLEDANFWFNFYNKFVPNLPFGIQQRVQRTPFRPILSRNRNNPRAQTTTQRLFSLQERVNTQTHTVTLNTIENNSSRSREKLDDFVRAWENDNNYIKDAIDNLIKEIKKSTTSILNKLDNLNKLLKELLELINKKANELIEVLNNSLKEINNTIKNEFNKLNISLNEINNSLKNINKSIQQLDEKLINYLENKFNLFKNFFEEKIINVINDIDNLKSEISAKFSRQFTLIESTIVGAVETINGYTTAQLTLQSTNILTTLETSLSAFGLSINGHTTRMKKEIIKEINNFKNDLYDYLENVLKKNIEDCLNDFFKNKKDEFYKEIVDEVCCNIVGESYIKYDGDNLYMPTLIFKYKNKNINDARRYSQIKLRLNLKPEDINDHLIENLRIKIQQLSNYNYTAGPLRCVYVSENRLFKTTVFTQSKDDIIYLFDKIIPITKTKFLKQNISYTENSKRDYDIRKKTPLKGTNLNKSNFNKPCEMILNSVFLQINGLDRQIKIF